MKETLLNIFKKYPFIHFDPEGRLTILVPITAAIPIVGTFAKREGHHYQLFGLLDNTCRGDLPRKAFFGDNYNLPTYNLNTLKDELKAVKSAENRACIDAILKKLDELDIEVKKLHPYQTSSTPLFEKMNQQLLTNPTAPFLLTKGEMGMVYNQDGIRSITLPNIAHISGNPLPDAESKLIKTTNASIVNQACVPQQDVLYNTYLYNTYKDVLDEYRRHPDINLGKSSNFNLYFYQTFFYLCLLHLRLINIDHAKNLLTAISEQSTLKQLLLQCHTSNNALEKWGISVAEYQAITNMLRELTVMYLSAQHWDELRLVCSLNQFEDAHCLIQNSVLLYSAAPISVKSHNEIQTQEQLAKNQKENFELFFERKDIFTAKVLLNLDCSMLLSNNFTHEDSINLRRLISEKTAELSGNPQMRGVLKSILTQIDARPQLIELQRNEQEKRQREHDQLQQERTRELIKDQIKNYHDRIQFAISEIQESRINQDAKKNIISKINRLLSFLIKNINEENWNAFSQQLTNLGDNITGLRCIITDPDLNPGKRQKTIQDYLADKNRATLQDSEMKAIWHSISIAAAKIEPSSNRLSFFQTLARILGENKNKQHASAQDLGEDVFQPAVQTLINYIANDEIWDSRTLICKRPTSVIRIRECLLNPDNSNCKKLYEACEIANAVYSDNRLYKFFRNRHKDTNEFYKTLKEFYEGRLELNRLVEEFTQRDREPLVENF
jgi:hypothetical protein